jgi:hypothetical protein
MSISITTARELCRPLGRPDFALDFPVDVEEFDPQDLKPLIGQEVYVQCKHGRFSFANGQEHHVRITDISPTKIYGKVRGKPREGVVDIDLDSLTLLEWKETLTKRLARKVKVVAEP